jgi:hypothetical protein
VTWDDDDDWDDWDDDDGYGFGSVEEYEEWAWEWHPEWFGVELMVGVKPGQ